MRSPPTLTLNPTKKMRFASLLAPFVTSKCLPLVANDAMPGVSEINPAWCSPAASRVPNLSLPGFGKANESPGQPFSVASSPTKGHHRRQAQH